ncbi:MAG: TIGR03905 family TSCPD domain-containing protein [Clostridia bacterium]|nr:TIGR03905 family TSCPD domain-containing protein [Clostridia bacterium]
MNFKYKTMGTCSREIDIELDGTTVKNVKFTGGCAGNLQGIASLVKGMETGEVIDRLSGIRCGFKPTSCPDQLARALAEIQKNHL